MPKNKGKGGKNRRRGKNENEGVKRELNYKEDGQEYARVERLLGNGRLEAYCFDGTKRLCNIRGKLRKKVWINAGDIILVGLRDYQDNKADVIMKYLNDEARALKALGEIPDSVQVDDYNDIQFDEDAAKFDMGPDEDDESSDSKDEDDSDSGDDEEGVGLKANPNHPSAGGAQNKKAAAASTKTPAAASAHQAAAESSDEDVKFAAKDESDEEETDSDEESEGDEDEEEESFRYKSQFGPDKFKKDKRVNHPSNKYGRGGKGKRGK